MIFLLRTLFALMVCSAAWAGDSIAVLERSALAIERSAQVLGQCGVEIAKAELVRLDAPARFRVFDAPRSRELAGALA
jgi:hypothetical protein